jgi:D-alanyl-D-alanine carboxypeptidase
MPTVVGHTGSSGSWLFPSPKLDLLLADTIDEASSGALPYGFVPRLLKVLELAAR